MPSSTNGANDEPVAIISQLIFWNGYYTALLSHSLLNSFDRKRPLRIPNQTCAVAAGTDFKPESGLDQWNAISIQRNRVPLHVI